MNANTLCWATRLPGAAQGASSTAEFEFKNVDGANAEFSVPPVLAKRYIRLKAGGRVTGGTTTNFTVKIYVGTALGAAVFTSGAIAVNSTSANFLLAVEGIIDATSGELQGVGYGNMHATAVAEANVSVAADPTGTLVFCASGQFSASNASNAAVLDFLELEIL